MPVQTNRWTVAEVRFSEFRDPRGNAPASGVHVEAIYLLADLDQHRPRHDVPIPDRRSIASGRPRGRFHCNDSGNGSIRSMARVGEPQRLPRRRKDCFRSNRRLRSFCASSCTLKTPDGRVAATEKLYDDGTHGDRQSADGIWTNSNVYSLAATDQLVCGTLNWMAPLPVARP